MKGFLVRHRLEILIAMLIAVCYVVLLLSCYAYNVQIGGMAILDALSEAVWTARFIVKVIIFVDLAICLFLKIRRLKKEEQNVSSSRSLQ